MTRAVSYLRAREGGIVAAIGWLAIVAAVAFLAGSQVGRAHSGPRVHCSTAPVTSAPYGVAGHVMLSSTVCEGEG